MYQEDEQAVADQPAGDGALHGLGHPVAHLPDPEDVFHVDEGDLDAPPRRVAGDGELPPVEWRTPLCCFGVDGVLVGE